MCEIVGIGVDIVNQERIEKLYHQHGDNFVNKFNMDEIEQIKASSNIVRKLSNMWAAKESVIKAFGGQISVADFSIITLDTGQPTVVLHKHPGKCLISISDEPPYSISYCVHRM